MTKEFKRSNYSDQEQIAQLVEKQSAADQAKKATEELKKEFDEKLKAAADKHGQASAAEEVIEAFNNIIFLYNTYIIYREHF
jgi:hypothetical protein